MSCFYSSGTNGIGNKCTPRYRFLLQLYHKMTAETCRLSPALINAMYRVISADSVVHRIQANITFSFITIGSDYQVSQPCFNVSKTEYGRTGTGSKLGTNAFSRQFYRIIGRSGYLGIVRERGSTLLSLATQTAIKGHQRHGTIILRTTAHYPMRIAKSLKQAVPIIIGSDTFLLAILRLGCPEVHAVRFEHGRQGLSVLFGVLAKQTSRLGGTWRSTHACINAGNQLLTATGRATRLHQPCDETQAAKHLTHSDTDRDTTYHSLIYIFFLYNGKPAAPITKTKSSE